MLTKLFGSLAIASGLFIAGAGATPTAANTGGCCSDKSGCSEGCCEGCPDCGCEGECCGNCADGCNCECKS